jgi:hypothetical protein
MVVVVSFSGIVARGVENGKAVLDGGRPAEQLGFELPGCEASAACLMPDTLDLH